MRKKNRTGEHVRIQCIAGCGVTGPGVLVCDPSPLVAGENGGDGQHEYEGHIAVCEACGAEAIDFYSWTPIEE
jgi:hypothetical protein